ncbi:plasma membrane proteolipid Pmp3 [Haplosporangium bisporale]|nr:plasma membrane proteolipid Pmp3 [Haplosporangium bisporale]
MALTCSDIFKFIFAVIFPPLGVLLERGCGRDLIINILLTCLGFIPGMQLFVHDIWPRTENAKH